MTKTSAPNPKDATEAKDKGADTAQNKAAVKQPKATKRAKSDEKNKAPAAKATRAKKAPQSKDKDESKGATYVISGPRQGRYRAGRYFNAEAQRIEAGDLSDAEIKALKADPMLTIELTTELTGEMKAS